MSHLVRVDISIRIWSADLFLLGWHVVACRNIVVISTFDVPVATKPIRSFIDWPTVELEESGQGR